MTTNRVKTFEAAKGLENLGARATPTVNDPLRLPPRILELARPVAGQLVETITNHIQERARGWAGGRFAPSRTPIETAVRTGVASFLDVLSGEQVNMSEHDAVFRDLGRQEAFRGNTMENLRATLLIASHSSWRGIRSRAREYHVPEGILGRIGDALFAHIERIERQMTLGHLEACVEMSQDNSRWRGDLAADIVSETKPRDLETLAAAKRWSMPEQIQVVAIGVPAEGDFPELDTLPDSILVHLARPHCAVIGDPTEINRVLPRLTVVFGRRAPMAVSWPVSAFQGAAGFRWATRAIELRELGIIRAEGVVQCVDHVAALWVHAEPLMRDMVLEKRLAPLLCETARSRIVLAETLLLLLETRGSAPAMAKELGVHPQTIRYRLRRLRDLFGDRLDDTQESLALLLALRSTLPLWQSEGNEESA